MTKCYTFSLRLLQRCSTGLLNSSIVEAYFEIEIGGLLRQGLVTPDHCDSTRRIILEIFRTNESVVVVKLAKIEDIHPASLAYYLLPESDSAIAWAHAMLFPFAKYWQL